MNFIKDKNIRIVLLILFSALFLVSAGILIYQGVQRHNAPKDHDWAESMAGIGDLTMGNPDDTNEPAHPEGPDGTTPPEDDTTAGQPADTDEPGTSEPPTTDAPVESTPQGGDETDPPETQQQGGDGDQGGSTTTKPPATDTSAYAEAVKGKISIKNLQKVNKDVVGWIVVEGAGVSEPLIYYSKDNDRYLRRKWTGEDGYYNDGCIYIDYLCKPDLTGYNTVIYGHHLRSGGMFGKLDNFKNKSTWEKNPNVYIYTADKMYTYCIFSVYRVDTDGKTFQVGFKNADSRQAFAEFCVSQAMYQTGISIGPDNHVITLSTCTGDTGANKYAQRFVVQAVLLNISDRVDQ